MEIELTTDDITTLSVDAIVNAANETLLGGGGVDGAIHRAAGDELLDYCRDLQGCPTGEAKISPGFNLPAQWIIHTVGPIWHGGQAGEANLLRSCYESSLDLAASKEAASLAFPAISTGVYAYPKAAACTIAVETVSRWPGIFPIKVVFCCFDQHTFDLYRAATSLFE